MNKTLKKVLIIGAMGLLGTSPSYATLIDFDNLPGGGTVANGTQITNQYASVGAIFSVLEDGVVKTGPIATTAFGPTGQQGNRLGNFFDWTGSGGSRADILRIDFSSAVSAVSFDFMPQGVNGGSTRVLALDSSMVSISDMLTGISGFPVIESFAVTGSGISRLDIFQPTDSWNWGLDNLQFTVDGDGGTPVPTPATLALFGLGLAGLGWSRRKKA